MKITWTEQDIRPGVRYSKPDISEVWIIGYMGDRDGRSNNVHSVSLTDGLITGPKARSQLADTLNKEGYVPVEILDTRFFKK